MPVVTIELPNAQRPAECRNLAKHTKIYQYLAPKLLILEAESSRYQLLSQYLNLIGI